MRRARLLEKEEERLVEMAKGERDQAVVKDVYVTASVNDEDELEMKLEWDNVKMRSRRQLGGSLVEHTDEESQTEVLRYKKDIRHLNQISPTPRSQWQKYRRGN